jgi:hypothetical protein
LNGEPVVHDLEASCAELYNGCLFSKQFCPPVL